MATIDNLDISIYNRYAVRQQLVEQINQQLRLNETTNIQAHTQIVDNWPKLTELDLLLGIVPMNAPWAYFFAPKEFNKTRRSPFAFFRVSPTLGSLKDQEEQEEALENTPCETSEEEKEKETLSKLFSELRKLNNWIGFILGRRGQFLQG